LQIVWGVMEAGANGVIMGRNVWGYKDPVAMIEAVSKIVHEEESVENTLKIIE